MIYMYHIAIKVIAHFGSKGVLECSSEHMCRLPKVMIIVNVLSMATWCCFLMQ